MLKDKIIDEDMLRRSRPILRGVPKAISMRQVFEHWKQDGHGMDPITSDALAKIKIKCPIYWDNEGRKDAVFNNYKCTCGRLFIFKNRVGGCPCDVCDYWSNGCHYGIIIV